MHTQLPGVLGPQVPSSVVSPVCQGGGSPVHWEAAMPENRSPRTTCGTYMIKMGCAAYQGLDEPKSENLSNIPFPQSRPFGTGYEI